MIECRSRLKGSRLRTAGPEIAREGDKLMSNIVKQPLLGLGLLLAFLSSAPGDPKPGGPGSPLNLEATARKLEKMERDRLAAAEKMYEQAWLYYKQARTANSIMVNFWSRKVLSSRLRLAATAADRAAAFQAHRDRMAKVVNLVRKVQKLGFSPSIDTDTARFFLLEAEIDLAREKTL